MKKKQIIYGFIAGLSILSTGDLTGCGDKFQEEYPWLVGNQEEQDNEE